MDPIVELQQGWRQGFAGQRLGQHLRGWGEREAALARFHGDTERLLRFLRTPPSRERDRVFCALLRQAKHDQLAGLVVLEALVPGLKALYGRILVEAGESDELLALLLENAWARIVAYSVERRPGRVAANLLLDIRKTTLKALIEQRSKRNLELGGQQATSQQGSDVELLLGRAVAAGALRTEDASLILATRIDGRSLPAVAAELGEPYITIYARRERAERRLLLHLRERPVKKRAPKRHMSSARPVALEAADKASGGAGT